jgi:hypothetical protein
LFEEFMLLRIAALNPEAGSEVLCACFLRGAI